jgi:hypothetical protein
MMLIVSLNNHLKEINKWTEVKADSVEYLVISTFIIKTQQPGERSSWDRLAGKPVQMEFVPEQQQCPAGKVGRWRVVCVTTLSTGMLSSLSGNWR